MEKTKLTPIRMPVSLIKELDKYIGEGQRSKFIIEATSKELLRLKQKKALASTQGIINANKYPEFNTSGNVAEWVLRLREESDVRRSELFGRD